MASLTEIYGTVKQVCLKDDSGVYLNGERVALDNAHNNGYIRRNGQRTLDALGGTVLTSMNTDYNTEINISSGDGFAYKRTNLNQLVDGSGEEGIIVRITTSTNNSIANMDVHLSGLLTSTLIT